MLSKRYEAVLRKKEQRTRLRDKLWGLREQKADLAQLELAAIELWDALSRAQRREMPNWVRDLVPSTLHPDKDVGDVPFDMLLGAAAELWALLEQVHSRTLSLSDLARLPDVFGNVEAKLKRAVEFATRYRLVVPARREHAHAALVACLTANPNHVVASGQALARLKEINDVVEQTLKADALGMRVVETMPDATAQNNPPKA